MKSRSTLEILKKHVFTLFNLVNLILALMVVFAGSPKNLLFVGVAIANTLIGVVNDLRAQKIVDRLRLLSEKPPVVLKNGQPIEISPDQVKIGDQLSLTLGDQISFDSIVVSGEIEVSEAYVTGEQDPITKTKGDHLISGSFVVSGTCTATVEHVASDNFITQIQHEASHVKTADSKLFTLMNKIVRYISYTLIPIGLLLLWSRFRAESDTSSALVSTVAALINMIPEGLILLTSSVLALATIRLGRRKVLVNDLYAIETLARIDTICLDKTGTLTTGRMKVHALLLPDGTTLSTKPPHTPAEKRSLTALSAILSTSTTENATSTALKAKLSRMPKFQATGGFTPSDITEIIPFSSARKYSGIVTKNSAFLLGAPEFLLSSADLKKLKSHSNTYRALALVKAESLAQPSHASTLLAIILLEDEIRPTAPKIIDYFYQNNIDVKIISGDDLTAVQSIAAKVGVKSPHGVNLSGLDHPDYTQLVSEYNIFTRVSPNQKKLLVAALRSAGHTVAMTGDGVNDILAMKEADASIAIGDGADAARRSAKFVLLGSGYEAVPSIIDEGRQSINNLERSTALFLAKTVYASILAVLFVFLPFSYPFIPIEMTLLNFLTIGLPGVILALESNTARPKDLFVHNITHYSVPAGILVTIAATTISIVAGLNQFPSALLHAITFVATLAINFALIIAISRPLNKSRLALLIVILALALAALLFPPAQAFFEFAFA